jgi:hypothetical protein
MSERLTKEVTAIEAAERKIVSLFVSDGWHRERLRVILDKHFGEGAAARAQAGGLTADERGLLDDEGFGWALKHIDALTTENTTLKEQLAERQKFKDWVHNYLDTHGVPHHPPGTHGEHGCRIGDRMDWIWSELIGECSKQMEAKDQELATLEQLAAKERECVSLSAALGRAKEWRNEWEWIQWLYDAADETTKSRVSEFIKANAANAPAAEGRTNLTLPNIISKGPE